MVVRLGFVGAGGRTVRELLDLVQIPEAQIAALCDIDQDRCVHAVAEVKAQTARAGDAGALHRANELAPAFYKDVRDLLSGTEVDAVYVSLPPFAHGAIEHAILDAGKALFVEKPVALTMTEAQEIQDHVRQAGVVSCAGYQLRYSTAVQKAREVLQGVPIGLVIAIRLGSLPRTLWWRVQSKSGGMLVEQHTHGVDLMRYLAGDVESAFAFANRALLGDVSDLDIADVNSATIRFASGAVGSIVNSCALQPGQGSPANVSGGIHIVAKDLTMTVSAANVNIMRPGGVREEVAAVGDPNLAMNQAFVDAVSAGSSAGLLSDYAEGVKTFEVTVACQRSADEGREIRIGSALPTA